MHTIICCAWRKQLCCGGGKTSLTACSWLFQETGTSSTFVLLHHIVHQSKCSEMSLKGHSEIRTPNYVELCSYF